MTHAVETVSTACARVHSPFEWCPCCNRPGSCYFGERVLRMQPRRGWNRADVLEAVLEAIETKAGDGRRFEMMDLRGVVRSGVWWSSVSNCLRWIEHVGIIARVPSPPNQRRRWYVVNPMKRSTDVTE